LQGGLGQIRFQLLKTGEPEGEAVKGGEKDGRRRNPRLVPGIGERCYRGAEVENLVSGNGQTREVRGRAHLAFS